jgi:hypothetical protein
MVAWHHAGHSCTLVSRMSCLPQCPVSERRIPTRQPRLHRCTTNTSRERQRLSTLMTTNIRHVKSGHQYTRERFVIQRRHSIPPRVLRSPSSRASREKYLLSVSKWMVECEPFQTVDRHQCVQRGSVNAVADLLHA